MMARSFLMLLAVTLGLLACAQPGANWPTQTPPPPDLLNPTSASAAISVRVILQFKQPVDYAGEAFLKTLREQARAPVRYVAAVSGDTHVYSLQWPAEQDPTPALQRLAALPVVARVELDRGAKPH